MIVEVISAGNQFIEEGFTVTLLGAVVTAVVGSHKQQNIVFGQEFYKRGIDGVKLISEQTVFVHDNQRADYTRFDVSI